MTFNLAAMDHGPDLRYRFAGGLLVEARRTIRFEKKRDASCSVSASLEESSQAGAMFFRRGITRLPLAPHQLSTLPREFFAFELLEEIKGVSALDEDILQRIARTMPAGERNARLTFARRRTDVDAAIADLIHSGFPGNEPVLVHDVAASNAVTSVDLFSHLEAMQNVSLLASDLHGEISFARAGPVDVVFDDQNRWIQMVWGQMVLNRRLARGDFYLVNFILTQILRFISVPVAAGKARRKTLSIFHPRALEKAAETARFRLEKQDILSLPAKQWHVVRAMSVLFNWPDKPRSEALLCLTRSVRDGGYFIVGTGNVSASHTTAYCSIFQRQGNRMVHVRDVGPAARESAAVLALEL